MKLTRPSTQVRWTAVGLVVVAGLVLALWPRSAPPVAAVGASATAVGVGTHVSAGPVDDGALTSARQAAALQPCPRPAGTSSFAQGVLVGVVATCPGDPGNLDLGAALGGRPVLVNLWAPWCGPCRTEIPVLAAYTREPGAIDVVGISVRDDPSAALALLTSLGVHYPSVTDTTGRVEAVLAGPPVLPLSFLIGADGTVQRVRNPGVFTSVADVRGAVSAAGFS